ncbi:unnamed protein product [Lactuca saligna]|uniref:Uncharacterized protein n=1 Tax=Lactuca saligna TaxID=75948 RepID=A0AA36E3V2_LACSI|nr:unnamed protein product [Lactuca saligna]
MMFISAQYQSVDKFDGKEEYKRLKFKFHAVLVNKEDEVWSLVKIVKDLSVSHDKLFEGLLQNFHYHVVRANNVVCDFSVVDFPLMNLNDIICVANILSSVDVLKLQVNRKEDFLLSFAHIKLFKYNYYDSQALTDVELALAMG